MALNPAAVFQQLEMPERPDWQTQVQQGLALKNTGLAVKANKLALQNQEKATRDAAALSEAVIAGAGDWVKTRDNLAKKGFGAEAMKIDAHIESQNSEKLLQDVRVLEQKIKQAELDNAPEKYMWQALKDAAEYRLRNEQTLGAERTRLNAEAEGQRKADEFAVTGGATGEVGEGRQLLGRNMTTEQFVDLTRKTAKAKAQPSLAEQTATDWLSKNPGKSLADYEKYRASLNDPTGLVAVQTVDAAGKPVTKFVKKAEGSEFVAPPTADQLNRGAALKNIDPILGGISELSEKINVLNGVIAKASGEAEKAKALVNLNDDVAEYNALVSGFTPMIARAVGHTGVLTQQDVDSVKEMFPKPGDSKSLRDRKIARVKTILGDAVQPSTTVTGSALDDEIMKAIQGQ